MQKLAIHSVPRSGSTWLGQIFNSNPNVAYRYQPLFSFAFKDRLNEYSSPEEIETFFGDILLSRDEFLLQTGKKKLASSYPVFQKNENPTHIIYKEVRYHHIIQNLLNMDETIRVIGLVRNPMGVLNSWFNSPREFRWDLGWDPLIEWREAPLKNQNRKEDFFGFEKWKEVALMFLRLKEDFPERFYLLKYDELLKNPIGITRKLFSFAGLELTPVTEKFLLESRMKDDHENYGVYKSHKADVHWKKTLDSRIVESIHTDLKNTILEQFIQ